MLKLKIQVSFQEGRGRKPSSKQFPCSRYLFRHTPNEASVHPRRRLGLWTWYEITKWMCPCNQNSFIPWFAYKLVPPHMDPWHCHYPLSPGILVMCLVTDTILSRLLTKVALLWQQKWFHYSFDVIHRQAFRETAVSRLTSFCFVPNQQWGRFICVSYLNSDSAPLSDVR